MRRKTVGHKEDERSNLRCYIAELSYFVTVSQSDLASRPSGTRDHILAVVNYRMISWGALPDK